MSHNKWRTPLHVWKVAGKARENLINANDGALSCNPSTIVTKAEKSYGVTSAPIPKAAAYPVKAIPVHTTTFD